MKNQKTSKKRSLLPLFYHPAFLFSSFFTFATKKSAVFGKNSKQMLPRNHVSENE
jgi:hypothetical protein